MHHHGLSPSLLNLREATEPHQQHASTEENTSRAHDAVAHDAYQEHQANVNPHHSYANALTYDSPTRFPVSDNDTRQPSNGIPMDIDQACPTYNQATAESTEFANHQSWTLWESCRRTAYMFSRIGRARPQPYDQILQWRLDDALKRYQKLEMDYQDIYSHYMYQRDMTIRLNSDMSIVMEWNRNIMSEKGQLEHDHADLLQQYNDLQHKYNKKVESYKELDKNYMDLLRPLLVTSDDPSTIYNGLMKIRVSIENLIQKSKGDRSINLQHKTVIGRFKKYGLLEVFPEETLLDSYHLNLYMESEVMMVLIRRMFTKPLGYLLRQSKEFDGIRRWVGERDQKMATRWRQQLCLLVAQDVDAMARRREEGVSETARVLSNMISTVYSHVDMSAKIKELCYDTFDLSFAMFGMESMIYPVRVSLGIPFDNENMTTPHKSNPAGSVSLVIFPAFQDDDKNFYLKPKVWCR